jgi:hypothetical protein
MRRTGGSWALVSAVIFLSAHALAVAASGLSPEVGKHTRTERPYRSDYGTAPGSFRGLAGPQIEGRTFAASDDVIITVPESSQDAGMMLEITVPDLRAAEVCHDGLIFQKIAVEGYGYTSEVGKPRMPAKGFLLAVPEGATLEIEVLRAQTVTMSRYRIWPVPESRAVTEEGRWRTIEEFCMDAAAYSQDAYYPESPAQVGSYGYLRDVRVAQLRLCPIQYNPASGELRIHKRLWLRARLVGGGWPQSSCERSRIRDKRRPFEALYESLILNYDPALKSVSAGFDRIESRAGDLRYLSGEALKMSVAEDGLHEITYVDLIGAGVSPDLIDPGTIKIVNLGVEISIEVTGQVDGTFDRGDRIRFLGKASRSEYASTNTYWLSWGEGPGGRMPERSCSPGDSLPIAAAYPESLHFEEDNRYYSNVYQGEGQEHWFWEQLNAPCEQTYEITVPGVAGESSEAHLTVTLRGKTGLSHQVLVYINEHLAGEILWDDMVEISHGFSFPQAWLVSGANELKIECPSSGLDQVFLDWFDIEYHRDFEAENGVLMFRDDQTGPGQYEISGFSDAEIGLYDITDPLGVIRLEDPLVMEDGASYAVKFESDSSGREYLALCRDRASTPLLAEDEPSRLRSRSNQADYIIISHGDFCQSIEPLADLRRAEGLNVIVVKIDDVYDEFSYGNLDPGAIRDFLEFAYYEWQYPAPSYALLVGDASFDYRGNIPGGNTNYVPTHLFVTQSDYLEACSDDWFGYIVGDDLLPDILIGRLSAQTPADVDAMVDKIVGYETAIEPGDWRRKILLVADDPDEGGDFEAVCDGFADSYISPAGFTATKVYVSRCWEGCRQQILDQLDAGRVICHFLGHGSLDLWTREQIFQSSDVPALSNAGRLPLVVAMTCLNGFFHHASDDHCLAEALTRPDGKGAVACWCHSGLDYTSCSDVIGQHLYDAFFNKGNCILGSAVCETKAAYLATSPYFWDQAEMLILFGDPALEMGFPGRPDLLPGSLAFRPVGPAEGAADTIDVTIYNAGRESAPEAVVRFLSGHPDSVQTGIIAETGVAGLGPGEQVSAYAVWDSLPEAGVYRIFVEVDPEDLIPESSEWNNTAWDTLRVLTREVVADSVAPTVELMIDDKVVGTELRDCDYVSARPTVEAVLTDNQSGINTLGIELLLNQMSIGHFELSTDEVGSSRVRLRCCLDSLADGHYDLKVRVSDCGCEPNTTEANVSFTVESGFRIAGVLNYPNPMAASTRFTYALSQRADLVSIRVYTVRGRLVDLIEEAPGGQSRNSVIWHGEDRHGDRVASGIYFYSLNARRGDEEVHHDGKLVIVR